jgi:hypothetical protein
MDAETAARLQQQGVVDQAAGRWRSDFRGCRYRLDRGFNSEYTAATFGHQYLGKRGRAITKDAT